MISIKSVSAASAGLLLVAGTAWADVELYRGHMPPKQGAVAEFTAECVSAVRRYWPSEAGLVLKRRARLGRDADGADLLDVNGHVWQDGKRVSVSHQCALQSGSPKLALFVQSERRVAGESRP